MCNQGKATSPAALTMSSRDGDLSSREHGVKTFEKSNLIELKGKNHIKLLMLMLMRCKRNVTYRVHRTCTYTRLLDITVDWLAGMRSYAPCQQK